MKTAINLIRHPQVTSPKPYLSLIFALIASIAMILYNYLN